MQSWLACSTAQRRGNHAIQNEPAQHDDPVRNEEAGAVLVILAFLNASQVDDRVQKKHARTTQAESKCAAKNDAPFCQLFEVASLKYSPLFALIAPRNEVTLEFREMGRPVVQPLS